MYSSVWADWGGVVIWSGFLPVGELWNGSNWVEIRGEQQDRFNVPSGLRRRGLPQKKKSWRMRWKHVGCLKFATENGTRIKRHKIMEMVNKQYKTFHMLTHTVCYSSFVAVLFLPAGLSPLRPAHGTWCWPSRLSRPAQTGTSEPGGHPTWTHGIMGAAVFIDKHIVIAVENVFDVTQDFMQFYVLFHHFFKLPSSFDIYPPQT